MHDSGALLLSKELAAQQARADLVEALASLRDSVTPAHLASALAQSARSAAAPFVDPLIEKTKSSSGLLVLAGSAAAVIFGLGRASVASANEAKKPVTAGQESNRQAGARAAAAKTSDTAPAAPTATASNPARPAKPKRDSPGFGKGLAKTLLLAAAGLAAGSAFGTGIPLTDNERQFGKNQGRDIRRWAQRLAEDHAGELMNGAVNSFGIASRLGTLIGVAALVAAQFETKPKGGSEPPPATSTG